MVLVLSDQLAEERNTSVQMDMMEDEPHLVGLKTAMHRKLFCPDGYCSAPTPTPSLLTPRADLAPRCWHLPFSPEVWKPK